MPFIRVFVYINDQDTIPSAAPRRPVTVPLRVHLRRPYMGQCDNWGRVWRCIEKCLDDVRVDRLMLAPYHPSHKPFIELVKDENRPIGSELEPGDFLEAFIVIEQRYEGSSTDDEHGPEPVIDSGLTPAQQAHRCSVRDSNKRQRELDASLRIAYPRLASSE